MSGDLKSAYERAMERLKEKGGEASSAGLTDEQRSRIGAVRAEHRARRAEAEVLHQSAVAKAREANDPQRLLALEEDFQREVRRLQAQEDEEIRAIREG